MAIQGLRGIERRFLLTGNLALTTAMHIGGGDAAIGATDSPVLRSADGRPYIPGTSIKGAFRSMVQKLALTLDLIHEEIDVLDTGSAWMRAFHQKMTQQREREGRNFRETSVIAAVYEEWPATARLFGTSYTAGKISFSDAYLLADQDAPIQRRDGVAIDRDSERAMDRLLYNYEVVPPSLRFNFVLTLENPDTVELGLACMGIAEVLDGFFGLGGKRSSGLGRCTLEDARLYLLDLRQGDAKQRAERLVRYLKATTLENKYDLIASPRDFINTQIENMLKEARYAETPRE